jgi:hypothetical protein
MPQDPPHSFDYKKYITIPEQASWLASGFTAEQYGQIVSYFETLDNPEIQDIIRTGYRDHGGKLSLTLHANGSVTDPIYANYNEGAIHITPSFLTRNTRYYSYETGQFHPFTLDGSFLHEFIHLTLDNHEKPNVELDAMLKVNRLLPDLPKRLQHGISAYFDAKGLILSPDGFSGTLDLVHVVAADDWLATHPPSTERDESDKFTDNMNETTSPTFVPLAEALLANPALIETLSKTHILYYRDRTTGEKGSIDLRGSNLHMLADEVRELNQKLKDSNIEDWTESPQPDAKVIARTDANTVKTR